MLSKPTRKSNLERAVIVAGVALAGALSGAADAGGMIVYEVGTADFGLASAGYGARAQDASTVFRNPAGMTRLEGSQFLFQQSSSQISPLLAFNTAWRFGVGSQQQLSKTSYWDLLGEYLYGGALNADIQARPGGRGDLVGSNNSTDILFFGAYYNWTF